MKRILAKLILVTTMVSTSSALVAEQMYRWVDKEGVTHFTREPPDESEVGNANPPKADANRLSEKEDYLAKRRTLEERMSGAIHEEKRDQFRREILVLDYNWYKDKDPQKAAELKNQLGTPQIKVIPKQDKQPSDMEKYKAFY